MLEVATRPPPTTSTQPQCACPDRSSVALHTPHNTKNNCTRKFESAGATSPPTLKVLASTAALPDYKSQHSLLTQEPIRKLQISSANHTLTQYNMPTEFWGLWFSRGNITPSCLRRCRPRVRFQTKAPSNNYSVGAPG